MQTNRHHPPPCCCFLIEHIKLVIELLLKALRVETVAFKLYDIIEVDGVRHDYKILILHRNDKWLIGADIVDMIGETKFLKQGKSVRRSAHGRAIIAFGRNARHAFDDLYIIGDEFALRHFIQIILWRPSLAVSRGLVPTLHNLTRQFRCFLHRNTHHV